MFLAADIGGTKADFALFEMQQDRLHILKEITYPSKHYSSLESLIQVFWEENLGSTKTLAVKSACFSLAGPVRDGFCNLVNLNWQADLEKLKKTFPSILKMRFCNDLEAVGYYIPHLTSEELFCLTPDLSPAVNFHRSLQNKAILAPGTGLGESLLIGGTVYPSEGAHCDFAPQTEEEVSLWRFLHQKYGHVSYERILSGPGIKNIYDFLSADSSFLTGTIPSEFRKVQQDLQPEQISSQALTNSCPVCRHTLDLFLSILAAEAGNLALKSLAMGGVYLGGGILPENLPLLQTETFLKSFRAKGRFSDLLEKIPVCVILNRRAALWGAALLAAE